MVSRTERAAQHKARVKRRELKAQGKQLIVLLRLLEQSPQPETFAVYQKRQELEGLIRGIIDQLRELV